MTKLETVQQINRELHELKAEAQAQGDSPRVKALIGFLIRLTEPFNPETSPEPACKHEHVEQGVCQQCGGTIPSLQTGEPTPQLPPAHCAHGNINAFGVCRDCGNCLHQFRNAYGTCNQCGDQAELEAPTIAAAPEPGASE